MTHPTPLTIEDIRNDDRISGFDHVGRNDASGSTQKPYQADVYGGSRDKAGRRWKGQRRATAEEAAQDYCDYVNSNGVAPATPALKSPGHNGRRAPLPRDEEVEYALGVLRDAKGQAEGKQGYVYLIIEVNTGGALGYGKVGFSTNPAARVAELQCGNPRELALHCAKKGTLEDEAALHRKYIASNVLQEWFVISRELALEFDLNENLVPFGGTRTGRMSCGVPSDASARVTA